MKRIEDVRALRQAQFPEDGGPLAHPARPDHYKEINNFYTTTVYEKGAEIVRMLATLLGEAGFRKGMDLYFERHDGEATTIEAFIKVFEDANGVDLQHFQQWYLQAGTPEVTVTDSYDAASQTYTLTLSQETQPTPGQPRQAAHGAADQVRADRPQWQPDELEQRQRRRRARRPDRARHAASDPHLHRRAEPAGAVAVPRLLGAGEAPLRGEQDGPAVPRPARQRSVQPLAGAAGRVDGR